MVTSIWAAALSGRNAFRFDANEIQLESCEPPTPAPTPSRQRSLWPRSGNEVRAGGAPCAGGADRALGL